MSDFCIQIRFASERLLCNLILFRLLAPVASCHLEKSILEMV